MARINKMSTMVDTIVVLELVNPKALKSKTVAITGHLGKARDEIIKLIETAGGYYETSVRRGLNILITNEDWTKGTTIDAKFSTKLMKAREMQTMGWKITIMTEKEFYDLITTEG